MNELKSTTEKKSGFLTDVMPMTDLMDMCKMYANSEMAPKHLKGKPGDVFVVMQTGHELGMKPGQALQQVVPINGLPTIKGDGAKALIFSSGLSAEWVEVCTETEDDYTYTISSKRKDNGQKLKTSFSLKDAKKAGLIDTRVTVHSYKANKDIPNPSPWFKYPKRMIMYRALGFHARDLYPDVMQGLYTKEEAEDIPHEEISSVPTKSGEAEIKTSSESLNLTDGMFDKVKEKEKEKEKEDKEIEEIEEVPIPEVAKKQETVGFNLNIAAIMVVVEASPKIKGKAFRGAAAIKVITNTIATHADIKDIELFLSKVDSTYDSVAATAKYADGKAIKAMLTAYKKSKEAKK